MQRRAGRAGLSRRAALASILTGAKPGELPFDQPDQFGLEISAALLARADEVIE